MSAMEENETLPKIYERRPWTIPLGLFKPCSRVKRLFCHLSKCSRKAYFSIVLVTILHCLPVSVFYRVCKLQVAVQKFVAYRN